MKKIFTPFLFLSFALTFSCGSPEGNTNTPVAAEFRWEVASPVFDFAKYVNPMIGTAGHGHTFPGATAPFGMVQLSPDTRVDGSWDGCSGYHYDDSLVYGFSHTHLSGTGCSDYGDILLMPGTGEINFNNGADGKAGYRSAFHHANEKAEAGYYSLLLENSGTQAELTASPRVGLHRYTFPKGSTPWIILDLEHRDEVIDAHFEKVNDHAICGYRFSKAWANDQRLWFYAEFSEPFTIENPADVKADSASGKTVKTAFRFDTDNPVIVKLALSPVSSENAKLNMETEVPDFDFDAVRKKVMQQWNNELGKVEVKSADETKKKIFYTALYHCFTAPNLYCDVNGDYRGMDKQVHRDTIHPQYTVFSLWDTYRALHPLFTIVQPKRNQDFINTFLKEYKEGGRLPVWELSSSETDCMIGYHSVPVIVDAWMKGQTNFDTALAYEAMKHGAMLDDRGLKDYKRFGFIPAEGESESVSKTLEYAYDDWCIALAAKRMKKEEDFQYFMRRSQNWKNLFDPKTGFMRARLNNAFVEPFDPNEVNFHYTEANAWQYSLAVQQQMGSLNEAFGNAKMEAHLDSLFSVSSATSGRSQADITGLIGQYAQGNEPSHHMAYVYDILQSPYKTAQIVSHICKDLYTDKPDGLCGNEDCGQMSAWYVLSSAGIYPVNPCGGIYQTGAIQFDEVIFHLENGKTFSLKGKSQKEATLPDGTFPRPEIHFSDIQKGGSGSIIVYENFNGTKPASWTSKQTDFMGNPVLPVPYISNTNARSFSNELKIELKVNDPTAIIYYQLNNKPWEIYASAFLITENTKMKTCAVPKGVDQTVLPGDTALAEFFKAPSWKSIHLKNQYQNQYAAGGERALIDGIHGPDNFRTGSWQGYEGDNLEAVIDLGGAKEISKISIGFLQDQGAWIFMPSEVIFYVSSDGINFTEIGNEKNMTDWRNSGTILHDFSLHKTATAKFVKVLAKNTGTCPDWHPGKGNKAWIFADEIVIETK